MAALVPTSVQTEVEGRVTRQVEPQEKPKEKTAHKTEDAENLEFEGPDHAGGGQVEKDILLAARSSYLFRAHVHGLPGYATFSFKDSAARSSASSLKLAALSAVLQKRSSSVDRSARVEEKKASASADKESVSPEDQQKGMKAYPMTSTSTFEEEALEPDAANGRLNRSSSSISSSSSSSDSALRVNDDESHHDFFIRIMWNAQDRFVSAIDTCSLDDDMLCSEAQKWVIGNESMTTISKIYRLWEDAKDRQSRDESLEGNTATAGKTTENSDDPSRTSDTTEADPTKGKTESVSETRDMHGTSTTSEKEEGSVADQSTAGSDVKNTRIMPAINKIAYIELVPRNLVPLMATKMRIHVTGFFSCKDMYDKTFHKYEISARTGNLEWTFAKRYREFYTFYSSLRDAWHALPKERKSELRPLPKIPPKRIIGSTKTSFLEERQHKLEQFLQLLTLHPWASEQASFLSFTGMLSDTRNASAAEGRNVIHLSRILEFVKPGDVILFKSANKLAGLQRKVTWSEWDHCGIVVELRNRRNLYLLESTGDGVKSYSLVSRIRAYAVEFTKYMAIRRLKGPRRRHFKTSLKEFTASVRGAKYNLGILKLLKKQTFQESAEKGFFCSELVAAAWQATRVIKTERAPNQFWPTDFADGGVIEKSLMAGWTMEPTVLIDTRVLEVGRSQVRGAAETVTAADDVIEIDI